jgi:Fe-S cluster biogenesis protein NfuA
MFIQTEETPNPNTLKFIPGVQVLEEGTVEFKNKDSAEISNLAKLIFRVSGVERVFLATEFVSVTKTDDETNWEVLKPLILTSIMDHYASGEKVLEQNKNNISASIEEDTEVVKQIKELIDQRVRPAVAMDGGDISFCSFENGVVTLQMKGACAGCPSSTATLKMGIENMLRHYIPEVVEVKAAEL